MARVVGMLRMDLEAIAASRPLLCFDEMDLLQTTEGDPRRKQHAQVLELLESLRGVAPLLLIGQRVYVDTDAHIALEPLPPTESGELLRLLGLEPDAALLHQVHQFTRGNPRLLELYAALRHSGEEAGDLLRLSRAPSSQPLFSRLWRRLDPAERDLMGMLSVFRTYAPRDAWPEGEKTLADLVNRGLIKIDLAEGVALLPFFRELIYGALPPERLKHMHVGAANLRAGLGDYTAAAFHFVQAGDPDTAVEVWFAHQNQEVLAGQAAAAGEIFQPLAPDQLEEANRTRLRVIQNRLALLAGEADRVLEGMEGFTWEVDDETTAEALGQWAYALEVRDEFDGALARYDEAIDMLSRATQKVTGWHLRRGFVYMGASDPSRAREEVLSAKCDIERLQGIIDYEIGQYASAQTHYRTALQYAEEAADERRIAGVHHIMSLTAGRLGDMAEARANTEKAIEFYARIGDRVQLEGVRAELAGLYLNVRQFEEVIGPAEKALQYFERIKHDRWIASISTNLAEAYLETGRLDDARQMVFKVMRMEIPSDQPYALYTLGHLHDREGNPEHAAKSFRQGIDIATANHDPFIEAYLQRALGSLLGKNGDAGKGREHLETALRMFTEMGLEHETGPTAEAIRALG